MMKNRCMIMAAIVLSMFSLSSCSSDNSVSTVQLQKVCELATIQTEVTAVAVTEKGKSNILQANRTYWEEFEMNVDLAYEIEPEDITVKGNTVTVIFPSQPTLKFSQADTGSKSYYSKNSIIKNNITMSDRDAAKADAVEKAEKEILENETICEMAEERTKAIITSYIESLGSTINKNYKVEFKDED
ncbi:DUF4230 domain-containing protein [Eubacterium oxidoreducens]|uniref:DUF4230 domain-containing protein n=1 Tax=Eubacterium oxidoreducens TaxID=1732 RepID=A0A1G6C2F4_EUBOX|nr:DUF4230 domain-containing protein [Eubacterium oxidoreducens]SDB27053.1 Protein of unknown function [Eubacterium oxidoreducens]